MLKKFKNSYILQESVNVLKQSKNSYKTQKLSNSGKNIQCEFIINIKMNLVQNQQ